MSSVLLGATVISALMWCLLLVLPWRPWSTRERIEPEPDAAVADIAAADITVLIPARNEAAHIAATVSALRMQARHLRIIVIDDESSDGTGQLARDAGAEVIQGRPPPIGWTGKLWALEQGCQRVASNWILQVDADIHFTLGMLSALIHRQQQGYDLVSVMALLPTVTFWQRMLLPAYVWFFKLLYPFHLSNGPRKRFAAAAGGCILLRREVLERIGGYAVLRHAVIDDCTLAACCKQAKARTWLGLSRGVVSRRASASFSDIKHLVARTAYTQLRHSVLLLLAASALLMQGFWLAPVIVWLTGVDVPTRVLAVMAWLAMMLAYVPLLRYYRLSPLWALSLPLIATLYLWMTWVSAWRHWRGQGAIWKGRHYHGCGADAGKPAHAAALREVQHTDASDELHPTKSHAMSKQYHPNAVTNQVDHGQGPIFIIGSPRSGTSILHWSLLQHEALWGSEESEFLTPLARSLRDSYDFGARFGEHAWLVKQKVTFEEYCAAVGSGVDALYRNRSGGLRWVEQTPAYSHIAAELALMFPSARFLYLHRDGRKVNESMRRMWQYDVIQAAKLWCEHNESCQRLEQLYPERVMRVQYEKLVAGPEAVFRTIFAFLNLAHCSSAATFLADKAPINISPGTEYEGHRDKLVLRAADWREGELGDFWVVAEKMMGSLGYEQE